MQSIHIGLFRRVCYLTSRNLKLNLNSKTFIASHQINRAISVSACSKDSEKDSPLNNRKMMDYEEHNISEDGEILKKLLDIVLKEQLHKAADVSKKVVEFRHPHELMEDLPLAFGENGCSSLSDIETLLQTVVEYSVQTTHPHYYNQLYGGLDEVALTSTWLLESLNTNQHTFEVAPAFIVIEKFMVRQIAKLFGWEDGDGIFAPGGSASNMYAINCARHKKFPHLKQTGYFGQKELVMFTSDMSHYSILKAANWLGFGVKQVVEVPTDAEGRMNVDLLEKAVESVRKEGREPFFVNATSGTTVLGSHDDLNAISDVCQKHQLWMHVDACWGGSTILSKKHKHLMAGSEKANSIAWNPHKMMCVPLQCSPFIVKDVGLLSDCNKVGATYLFQQDKFYDTTYDLGDKGFQCGRKADVLKLWLMFKIHGLQKLEARIDAAFEAARYLENEVRNREGFLSVIEKRDSTNVCFWYIPPSFRNKTRDEDWWKKLHKIAPIIKERMTMSGKLLIGYQPIESKKLVNFFRMITTSYPITTKEHVDFILDEIDRCGIDL